MKLVDLNVLLNAVNSDQDHDAAAKRWLDHALSGGSPVGIPWVVLLGFIRISTNPRVFAHPLSASEAMDLVDQWCSAPPVRVLHPSHAHATRLRALLESIGGAGNRVTDAHLAALAMEHKATVVSFDADYGRIAGIRWERPA